MPAWIPPLITSATGVLGNLLGNKSTRDQNRQSQKWSEEQYLKQRKDNIDFWNMQNAYNSPQAQMKRFEEAGLNKNLIYGQGSGGNAGSISSPQIKQAEFRPSTYEGIGQSSANFINQMYDIEMKEAQIDNLRADNTVKLEESALKEAQRLSTVAGTERTKFDLDFEGEMRNYSAEARKERVRQTKAATNKILNDDDRAQALMGATLKESAERVLNSRAQRARTRQEIQKIKAQIKDIKQSAELKRLDIGLKQSGIMPSDPLYMRILGRILGENPESRIKQFLN